MAVAFLYACAKQGADMPKGQADYRFYTHSGGIGPLKGTMSVPAVPVTVAASRGAVLRDAREKILFAFVV